MQTYLVIVADKKTTIEADSAMEAISMAYPKFNWGESKIPNGIREAGSFDGTLAEPFLTQVKKPNGVYAWFVNLAHKNAGYWVKNCSTGSLNKK